MDKIFMALCLLISSAKYVLSPEFTMKNKMMIRHAKQLVLGLALAAAAGSASATTWTFTGSTLELPSGYGAAQDTVDGITATATAWANTFGSTNTLLAKAYLTPQNNSGLGVKNADCGSSPCTGVVGDIDTSEGNNPEHAIDNNERNDSILFDFGGAKVNLTSSEFGWISTDSDFSVYAYTGTSVPAGGPVAGLSYGTNLTSNGWSLIGNFLQSSQQDRGLTSTNSSSPNYQYKGDTKSFNNDIYSSYWLIGAYSSSSSSSNSNDYFKLKTVSGVKYTAPPCTNGNCGGTGQAPEPGTLLLMGAGLLGLTRINSRRARRNAA
jgi:hypothetical protein